MPPPARLWIQSPAAGDAIEDFGDYCRSTSALPPRTREVVVLAVAAHSRCREAWAAHFDKARATGLSEEELADVWAGGAVRWRDADDLAVARFVERYLRDLAVARADLDAIVERFGPSGVVEIAAATSSAALQSFALNTLRDQPQLGHVRGSAS